MRRHGRTSVHESITLYHRIQKKQPHYAKYLSGTVFMYFANISPFQAVICYLKGVTYGFYIETLSAVLRRSAGRLAGAAAGAAADVSLPAGHSSGPGCGRGRGLFGAQAPSSPVPGGGIGGRGPGCRAGGANVASGRSGGIPAGGPLRGPALHCGHRPVRAGAVGEPAPVPGVRSARLPAGHNRTVFRRRGAGN